MGTESRGSLLITNVPASEWLVKIAGHTQIIGRSPDCDIVIPEQYKQVSRRHAQLDHRHQGVWIHDIGSSGGTEINGVPLKENRPTKIVFGDRIALAGLELYYISSTANVMEPLEESPTEEDPFSLTALRLREKLRISSSDKSLEYLSPAELEVVRWICRGVMTDKEIGKQLHRSPHTVRTQLCSVFQKLQIHSREQLIGYMKQREVAWTRSEDADAGPGITDMSMPVIDDSTDNFD